MATNISKISGVISVAEGTNQPKYFFGATGSYNIWDDLTGIVLTIRSGVDVPVNYKIALTDLQVNGQSPTSLENAEVLLNAVFLDPNSGSGSSGGNTIYTGDGALAGDRTVDLDGNTFRLSEVSEDFLFIDPTLNNESSTLAAINLTGDGNISFISLNTQDTETSFFINADFQDGTKSARIQAGADATTSSILHTADSHIFNGKINNSGLQDFANNAAAITGGLVTGDFYYTNVAGDGILKVVI